MISRFLLASSLCAMFAPAALAGVNVGDQAPKINAEAWSNLPRGTSRISLKQLRGRVVLLDFWATW